MTAPDHRPYLLPTDLRTAEDVARWLLEHAEQWRIDAAADPSLGARSVRLDYGGLRALQGAHADLRARLDRERRQACERGAEDCERRLAELGPEPEEPTIDIWGTEALRARLRESALAFRAAARAK